MFFLTHNVDLIPCAFLKLFLWQAERHADILATILARVSARMSVSVSASWNASLYKHMPTIFFR